MNARRADRFRRAAILVASLDETLAEQLLASLPPREAAAVLDEAERLESIDPEEQQDVVAEFRRLTRGAGVVDGGVEFTYSQPAEPAAFDGRLGAGGATPSPSVSGADAIAMAELLSVEHPQTIAAALSRLDSDTAAEVFAVLPLELQPEVIDRLANLQVADETAVLEVESHLQQRVVERREHRERAAAGAELARRIVARTPSAQRQALLSRIGAAPEGHAVVARMPRDAYAPRTPGSHAGPLAEQALTLASVVRHAQTNHSAYAAHDVRDAVGPADASLVAPAVVVEDCSADLELLSNAALFGALRIADESLVQQALAASSDRLVRRIMKMLRRRDSQRLRRLLRSLAPTRIADLRQAQARFLEIARACEAAPAAA